MKSNRELYNRLISKLELQEEQAGIVAIHIFQFSTATNRWLSFSITDTRVRGRMHPALIGMN